MPSCALSIPDLHRFLRAEGWDEAILEGRALIRFSGPADDGGQPVRIYLPTDAEAIDAEIRIADAVATLSAVSRCSRKALTERIHRTKVQKAASDNLVVDLVARIATRDSIRDSDVLPQMQNILSKVEGRL